MFHATVPCQVSLPQRVASNSAPSHLPDTGKVQISDEEKEGIKMVMSS